MKVNTDSVLLGAWAKIPKDSIYGVDLGAGTGVLSLMIAQRHPFIQLTGVEIESEAFHEASLNFEESPWANRLEAIHLPLQHYIPNSSLDFIISNPPYFINDLKNNKASKTMARHSDSLPFQEIIDFVDTHLSPKGFFNLILPVFESTIFREIAQSTSLRLTHIAYVKPHEHKEINRVMMCFSKSNQQLIEEIFSVYQSQGIYSLRHQELTKEFYLK